MKTKTYSKQKPTIKNKKQMKKVKTVFRKLISNPFVRGFIKQIPIVGTPIAEGLTNMVTEEGEPQKHNWTSIITQVVIAGVLVYLVLSKAISLDEFVAKMFFVSGE